MKTTLDINDALFKEARSMAQRRRASFRSIVEAALRQYLDREGATSRPTFRLRRHVFNGRGLRPELARAGWDRIREMSYGERDE